MNITAESLEVIDNLSNKKQGLIDPFGRKIDYLRISITDKCNLRCFYCLPNGFNNFTRIAQQLTTDELVRIVRAFTELGVQRVRLTGGEPLLRRDLGKLCTRFSALPGLEDLSLSTNASLLKQKAIALKQAGIKRINVSLDTLQAPRFQKISSGKLSDVINGLMAAKEAGFSSIKINMIAMKGVNDDEFENMVEFCLKHSFTLRFIETMPISAAGRKGSEHYYDLDLLEQRLSQRYELLPSIMRDGGPARYVQIKGTALHIGFITPISQNFCESCNRVRLTSTGTLYLCLGNEHAVELREPLRHGLSDAELQALLIAAIAKKPASHHFKENPLQIVHHMSRLGG